MENATKALLIAAAVLVAILIISLGIGVYNMASETMGNVDLSGTEVQAFNEQFSQYNGNKKRGSEVNAMLKTVLTSNLKEAAAGSTKFVNVTGTPSLSTGATAISTTADPAKMYKITVNYDNKTGLVNSITVGNAT